jgi:hypothetical protein
MAERNRFCLSRYASIRCDSRKVSFRFVLTYYDGERWQSDKQIVSVQIEDFIQQRPVLLGWLSIVAVLIAFLSLLSTLIVNFARAPRSSQRLTPPEHRGVDR